MQINKVVAWCWCVLGERISGYCWRVHYCIVVVVCLMCAGGSCGSVFVFVVVYYDIEDRVVYVCVYVVKL
jgi:hypothetical protein